MAQHGWLLTGHTGRYYLAPDHVFYKANYAEGYFLSVSGGAWDGDASEGAMRLLGFQAQIFSDVIEEEEEHFDAGRLFGYEKLSVIHHPPTPRDLVPRPAVSLQEMGAWRGERLPEGWAVKSWEDVSDHGRLIVLEARRLNYPAFAETLAQIQVILG